MKKLVLAIAIIGFVTFGALSIQNLVASSSHVVLANYDKDPKKDDNKKSANTKEMKADTKATESSAKSSSSSCGSSCDDKAASSHSCCSGEKASASKTSESNPDGK